MCTLLVLLLLLSLPVMKSTAACSPSGAALSADHRRRMLSEGSGAFGIQGKHLPLTPAYVAGAFSSRLQGSKAEILLSLD